MGEFSRCYIRPVVYLYNQLLHLLATADRSSFPSPAAATRRVFAHMLQTGAPPSEATITSLARVAATADANNPTSATDKAFGLVATMRKKHGLVPRLRFYSPVPPLAPAARHRRQEGGAAARGSAQGRRVGGPQLLVVLAVRRVPAASATHGAVEG